MTNNSKSNSRTTVVLAIFAMAIGVVAYYGVKYPIPEDGATGTVAPAERFRGEQITADDVTLGDESVAQLMQTDLYQQMVEDPELAEAFMDARVIAALSDPATQALYKDQAAIAAIADVKMQQAVSALASGEGLANSDALQATLQNPAAFKATLEAAAKLQANSQMQSANAGQQAATLNAMSKDMATRNAAALMQNLASNDAFLRAIQSDAAVRAVFEDGRLARHFSHPSFLAAIADQNIVAALQSADMMAALQRPSLIAAISNPRVAPALRDVKIASALTSTNLMRAMSDDSMSRAFTNSNFLAIVQHDAQASMQSGGRSDRSQ